MSCSDDGAWEDARIAKTRELISKYEDAIDALGSGVAQYSLDTGQSRQVVTKQNIASLMSALANLENRLATLLARRCGGSVVVKPAW